jgi:hypothetical protein
MLTTVKVTKDHITRGKRSHCEECMVALALKKVVHEDVTPLVSSRFFHLDQSTKPGEGLPLPLWVSNRINRWDRGEKTEPFEFEVEIPDHLLKEIPACS